MCVLCVYIYSCNDVGVSFQNKMAPPVYADLGKSAKDVFGKGYHFGLLKLQCKSKTNTGVEITAGGNNSLESGKVAGNLETKYKVKEHGKYLHDCRCYVLSVFIVSHDNGV